MFFASATVLHEVYGNTRYVLCSEESDMNSSSEQEINVHYERPIAQEIMKACVKGIYPIQFSCNRESYTLLSYFMNSYERYYNSYRSNHVVR